MQATKHVTTIDPVEVRELIDAGYNIDLVDVRTPAEYRGCHAEMARNIPLDDLNPDQLIAERGENPEPIYFICRSDSRGKKACEAVLKAGFEGVVNVAGGTVAWEDLGLPVVRGKQVLSLDRQVRLAAGSLVLVGLGLSLLSPWWLALSAFVGGGLVFAGLTDSCGMATLLAKMPWNQVKE